MLPIWVAKEGRLFDKHGLDLNLVYISGGPRSIMSLIGGSVRRLTIPACLPSKLINEAPIPR
jgi:ABC-type nitrate/sulfonate/bicarbonate transport system substrate-binding protein